MTNRREFLSTAGASILASGLSLSVSSASAAEGTNGQDGRSPNFRSLREIRDGSPAARRAASAEDRGSCQATRCQGTRSKSTFPLLKSTGSEICSCVINHLLFDRWQQTVERSQN
jgi:hypothetical protein